jgi:hypothetical protein
LIQKDAKTLKAIPAWSILFSVAVLSFLAGASAMKAFQEFRASPIDFRDGNFTFGFTTGNGTQASPCFFWALQLFTYFW